MSWPRRLTVLGDLLLPLPFLRLLPAFVGKEDGADEGGTDGTRLGHSLGKEDGADEGGTDGTTLGHSLGHGMVVAIMFAGKSGTLSLAQASCR